MIRGGQNIAEKSNDFFINVGNNLTKNLKVIHNETFQKFSKMNVTSNFNFSHVTCQEISVIIKGMQSKKCAGHDGISNELIKLMGSTIVYPISILINQSLHSGIFPDDLKIAKVLPIFKKKKQDEFENYRPISILPSLSKIFEKVVNNQILKYFTDNNLFMQAQHGFRPNFSTETASI